MTLALMPKPGDRWDGVTVRPDYGEPVHPYDPYDLSCLCCGSVAEVKWTDRRAELEMTASRFRCGRCNGAILIGRADYGAIASPSAQQVIHRNGHGAWRVVPSGVGM